MHFLVTCTTVSSAQILILTMQHCYMPLMTKQEAEDCGFPVARFEPIQFLLVGNVKG